MPAGSLGRAADAVQVPYGSRGPAESVFNPTHSIELTNDWRHNAAVPRVSFLRRAGRSAPVAHAVFS